jgi:hypothetical protein
MTAGDSGPTWLPIETAPVGGTFIVGWRDRGGQWCLGVGSRIGNGPIRSLDGVADLKATHWLPVPEPPLDESESQIASTPPVAP